MTVEFLKYQGLGNDFVLVDSRPTPEVAAELRAQSVAERICDRNLGIGGDGILIVHPASNADAKMEVVNADGSIAEMCGNGIRCVARYLWEQRVNKAQTHFKIETGAGMLACDVQSDGEAFISASVQMGTPRFLQSEIPSSFAGLGATEPVREIPLVVRGRQVEITALSLGNPHAVIFIHHRGEHARALAAALGPLLESHAAFPNRCNIEFIHRVSDRHLEAWVWERGCGLTMACGTGACAAALAACLVKGSPYGEPISVWLPGGPLQITIEPETLVPTMMGPAEFVFQGRFHL